MSRTYKIGPARITLRSQTAFEYANRNRSVFAGAGWLIILGGAVLVLGPIFSVAVLGSSIAVLVSLAVGVATMVGGSNLDSKITARNRRRFYGEH